MIPKRLASKERKRTAPSPRRGATPTGGDSGHESEDLAPKKTKKQKAKGIHPKIKGQILSGDETSLKERIGPAPAPLIQGAIVSLEEANGNSGEARRKGVNRNVNADNDLKFGQTYQLQQTRKGVNRNVNADNDLKSGQTYQSQQTRKGVNRSINADNDLKSGQRRQSQQSRKRAPTPKSRQQQQQEESTPSPASKDVEANLNQDEDDNDNADEIGEQDSLDPRTEKALQSYTKWIVGFIIILVIFIAAFAPLIYYATVIEEMEENTEMILDHKVKTMWLKVKA